ncbi:MAG: zf-HC2 domain-containing protein [bacterium]
MSDHLTHEQIASYYERRLPPAELIALDNHVAACVECRSDLSAGGFEQAKVTSLKQDIESATLSEHLDYDQLAGLADGTLEETEVELVESHLAGCAQCELLASDLRVFKDEIATGLGERYLPSPSHGMSAVRRQSFSDSLKAFFSFKAPGYALGIAALALLVIGLSIWLMQRSKTVVSPTPQLAESSSPAPLVSPDGNVNIAPGPSPGASAPALIALNDGPRNIGVDERGEVTGLDDLPPGLRQTITTAIRTQHAASPSALSGLSGQPGKLRGEGDDAAFTLLGPIKVVTLSDKPTLRWNKLNGATSYKAAIYDSGFILVTASPELTASEWTPPGALTRGEVYSWRVTAIKDGQEIKSPVPPAPEAKFKVLDRTRADELRRARRLYSGSHLTLGVLYAQAGLLAEAEREFLELAKANPQSTIAQNLLRDVRAARR